MNEHGSYIANLLDSACKAYAAGTVVRMQAGAPELVSLLESWSFRELVSDTQVRINTLAEALACGRPELFALDIEWAQSTHAARQVSPALLVATLECLAEELSESLPASAAATAVEYVKEGLKVTSSRARATTSEISTANPHAKLAQDFLLAILEGQRGKAEELLFTAQDQGVSVPDLHHFVITRAQAELGRMWQVGEVNIAEEHFGTHVVADILAGLRGRVTRAASNGLCLLSASVAGNLHDIGVRVVADQFEMKGWRSICLGANLPREDLVRARVDFEPDLVALSAGTGIHVRSVANAVQALKAVEAPVPIIVGGGPFSRIDDLWRDVGADACARTAEEAVEAAARLLDTKS